MDVRDERRVVTALFADLVGSTALGERLDPEELKLVVGDAVARMVTAVEAFGGTVKDLAGDGVLALFGAPVAHEDDPERAVRAGLRIVDEIAAFGREVAAGWGIDALNVRVGINTGLVVTGAIGAGDRVEFGALGDAVNVAARLQSHAGPGSVLVGQATQQIVADRFGWSEGRSFELKGKSEPMTAYTVDGLAAGSKGRADPSAAPRMVGRDRELDRLRGAVEGVAAGAGGVVFVSGEPGIGKTRMVHELRRTFGAVTPGHGRSLWIEGRCVSYGGSIPYWPFRDLLRSWLGVGDDEPELRVRVTLRRQVDRLTGVHPDELVPYLAALLGLSPAPGEAERLEELSPEALQYRTFEVVRSSLRRLAEDGPVAVALEDLHWPDATSIQLLHELIADTEQAALLIVCTLRPERDHGAWRLKEDVAHAAAPLPRGDARTAVGRRRPRAADRARRARHAAHRCGTPDPGAGGGEPVLPRGARAIDGRRGCARGRRRRLALRPRRRAPGAADGREGDPRAYRPASSGVVRGRRVGLGGGPVISYVFHLRDGLTWSDGKQLTAHDVEYGIKRVLNPAAPGSSVAIYFVLEGGQAYYLDEEADPATIGVRALDDRTVEFRLAAPAPYFMSVMNRPDGGPQPRHAIEALGDAWTEPGKQVVSGAFTVADRSETELRLERRPERNVGRAGNVATVAYSRARIVDALGPYERDELDLIAARYTPRLADLVARDMPDATIGPAGWSGYLAFDHTSAIGSNLELRQALAHAIDREALASATPANLIVATGGIVPPALQGHTPDIALRFDRDLARECQARSGHRGPVELALLDDDLPILEPVLTSWRSVLGVATELRTWSLDEIVTMQPPRDRAPIYFTGWLPGYADPEYFLRLLFHSQSRTNEGGFDHPPFDELIERARQERSDRGRLSLFHDADRMAVVDRVAVIPLVYGRSLAVVKPRVSGWWEFGKTSANFADLTITD